MRILYGKHDNAPEIRQGMINLYNDEIIEEEDVIVTKW